MAFGHPGYACNSLYLPGLMASFSIPLCKAGDQGNLTSSSDGPGGAKHLSSKIGLSVTFLFWAGYLKTSVVLWGSKCLLSLSEYFTLKYKKSDLKNTIRLTSLSQGFSFYFLFTPFLCL